jgi:hypothetical protein
VQARLAYNNCFTQTKVWGAPSNSFAVPDVNSSFLLATTGSATAPVDSPASEAQMFEPQPLADQLIATATEPDRDALQCSPQCPIDTLEAAPTHPGRHARARVNFAQAQVAFELARQLADRNKHPARVADAIRNPGLDARLQQRYAQAIEYFRAARAIAERIGDPDTVARPSSVFQHACINVTSRR